MTYKGKCPHCGALCTVTDYAKGARMSPGPGWRGSLKAKHRTQQFECGKCNAQTRQIVYQQGRHGS